MQDGTEVAGTREVATSLHELRDSLALLGLLVASMGAYVSLGLAAVKLLSG